ncbi:hypothetical protein HMPREF1436_00160 [Helicobacter pylori GAMchJs136i]|nr:hypothetical protein HMPREF1436_00160 [Helicobacter pylori GAMchJs136i]
MKNLKQGDSLSERMINKTFRQKRDKNLRVIFAWWGFRILRFYHLCIFYKYHCQTLFSKHP